MCFTWDASLFIQFLIYLSLINYTPEDGIKSMKEKKESETYFMVASIIIRFVQWVLCANTSDMYRCSLAEKGKILWNVGVLIGRRGYCAFPTTSWSKRSLLKTAWSYRSVINFWNLNVFVGMTGLWFRALWYALRHRFCFKKQKYFWIFNWGKIKFRTLIIDHWRNLISELDINQ